MSQGKPASASREIGDDQRGQHAERGAGHPVQHLDDDEQRRVLGQGRRGRHAAVTRGAPLLCRLAGQLHRPDKKIRGNAELLVKPLDHREGEAATAV